MEKAVGTSSPPSFLDNDSSDMHAHAHGHMALNLFFHECKNENLRIPNRRCELQKQSSP